MKELAIYAALKIISGRELQFTCMTSLFYQRHEHLRYIGRIEKSYQIK